MGRNIGKKGRLRIKYNEDGKLEKVSYWLNGELLFGSSDFSETGIIKAKERFEEILKEYRMQEIWG